MAKYTVTEIQDIKQKQQGWQSLYSQFLEELQNASNNREDEQDSDCFRFTDEYITYRLKTKKCQVCHKTNTFKFIRTKVCVQKDQLPFLMCDLCFFSQSNRFGKAKKDQCYVPSTLMLKNLKKSLELLKQPDQMYLNSYQKYNSYQKQLYYLLGHISKIVERNVQNICKQLRDQLELLKKYSISQRNTELFHFLISQSDCKCNRDCSKFSQCQLIDNKQKLSTDKTKAMQNQFIKQINLLQAASSLKKQESHIMDKILKDIELTLLKHSSAIQISLKSMAKETQNGCFTKFINTKAKLIKEKDTIQEEKPQKPAEDRRLKYLKEGIINSLTHNHISEISNHTSILTIDYCNSIEKIANKIQNLPNLEALKLNNSYVSGLVIQNSIKYFQTGKQTEAEQFQAGLIKKKLVKQLKTLEFNCKIPYKKEFIACLGQFPNLQRVCLTGNLLESFEKINESHHYLQDFSIMNSQAPAPFDLLQYYKAYKMQYLWIGNCDDSAKQQQNKNQLQHYLQILQKFGQNLEGIMFGQLDGRQRTINQNVMNSLLSLSNLKALFFNKIAINESDLLKVMENLTRLQALHISGCQLTSKCLTKINQMPLLRKLSLVQLKQLQFQKHMPRLQTFILQRCFSDSFSNFLEKSALKTLSLNECRFLQVQFINTILLSQLQNGGFLESVNLGYTSITNATLGILDEFSQLCKLNIGGTSIDLFLFAKQLQDREFKNLTKIQKLSLKQMKQIKVKIQNNQMSSQVSEYYNDIFSNILSHFTILTHLDLSFNQVINQRSIRFGLNYLAFISVAETKFTIDSKTKSKGVRMFFYPSDQFQLKFTY